MKISFQSSAELTAKLSRTTKKKRAIARVLFNRWKNSIGRLHVAGDKFQPISFGEIC
jgi:hypothetical protein